MNTPLEDRMRDPEYWEQRKRIEAELKRLSRRDTYCHAALAFMFWASAAILIGCFAHFLHFL